MSTTLLEGHVLAVLEGLPAGHFHTVCTSPPYWQLRAYGTPPQVWPDGWVGELGQEPTPEAFVAHLVAVFSAVRRVLRDDGTLWVNLAGSYWSEPGGQNGTARMPPLGAGSQLHAKQQETFRGISNKAVDANRENGRKQRGQHPVYKPLDWVDVPGLFARAMQANGWLWRSDVVWVKPSALPESVQGTRWERCRVKVAGQEPRGAQLGAINAQLADGTSPHLTDLKGAEWGDCPGCPKCEKQDGLVLRRGSGRPTKATERVLLFAKRAGYFFDQEAVREQEADSTAERAHLGQRPLSPKTQQQIADGVWWPDPAGRGLNDYGRAGRNLRDWWVLGPEPLKDAHYAAFPSALPERCIKAGTSEWGCCPACGAPWARCIGERRPDNTGYPNGPGGSKRYASDVLGRGDSSTLATVARYETTTLGWRPTCPCQPQQPPAPCRILDPFGGSGTTALAANRLGRDCTLVELKPAYAALARKRVGREPLSLFATHGGDAAPPPQEESAPEETKQERHPNRTPARVPPLVEAGHRPVGDTGGILPVEETEGAVAGG